MTVEPAADAGQEAGRVDVLSTRLRRVLAPNPSIMTGAGTNTYLVGDPSAVVVVDPGPDDPRHLDALLAAIGGARVAAILLTHTHVDHWPAAPRLAERTGAPVMAWTARDGLTVDRALADGETVCAGGTTLRAVRTPGHAANHLCFLLEEEDVLLTGDHVMHGSTVVLFPPDGDLTAYLASLDRVLELAPAALAPGHGLLFQEPRLAVEAIIEHRRARERTVLRALTDAGRAVTVDDLIPVAYADVEPRRHPIARGSLWAHLRALVDAGLATTDGYDDLETGTWTASPSQD